MSVSASRGSLLALHRRLRLDAEPLGDATEQAQGDRGLLLGQQVDLEIEVGAPVRLAGHAVLADQDTDGDEDRLEGHDHGQEAERVGVEGTQAGNRAQVDDDPAGEPEHVEQGEAAAAGQRRQVVADPFGQRPLIEVLGLEVGDLLDIGQHALFSSPVAFTPSL
jgi:hypothetical protein